jgi:hypothetical protein
MSVRHSDPSFRREGVRDCRLLLRYKEKFPWLTQRCSLVHVQLRSSTSFFLLFDKMFAVKHF